MAPAGRRPAPLEVPLQGLVRSDMYTVSMTVPGKRTGKEDARAGSAGARFFV